MAESMGHAEDWYDIFIVHSGEDNDIAEFINKALRKKGKKTFAHYKEGALFTPGKPVFDNIIHAVTCSKIVLILLTKKALESHWVSFEVLMGLEKSYHEKKMCVRFVFKGLSDSDKDKLMTGTYSTIPSIEVDFNKDNWVDELLSKIDEDVSMTDLLPGGNVAHGLVFNHYIGYLVYVLPATEKMVKTSEYFSQGKFSKKYFIIIPESCKMHQLDGQFDDIFIEKMETTIEMDVTHGDKRRKYNTVVYKVTKKGVNETYFFTGDIPFILGTMLKMKEQGFVDIDIHLQSVRFCETMQQLVEHRSPNNACKGKANIIPYDDNKGSFASLIWEALEEEFKETVPKSLVEHSKVIQSKGKLEEMDKMTASIMYCGNLEPDTIAADSVQTFLETKSVKFGNGNGKSAIKELDQSRWKIFILSEEGINDPHMSWLFNSALELSISDNKVEVIPVLANGSDLAKLPYHFRWTTLLKQSEPNYLDKLWNVMQEEKTMVDFLPAGLLYEGLAYAFLLNYMCFNLIHKSPSGRDFNERFIDAMATYCTKEQCICVPKVFVVVPKSCTVPKPGTQFEREVHLGALEPIVLGPRKYFLQFYQLTMSDGKKVCYAREYATPAIALHDMANSIPFAGLDKLQMNEQARLFAEFSNRIMQNSEFNAKVGKVSEKCSIIYFDDETEGESLKMDKVISVLEQELQRNISEGNFIRV